jgi:hypothetical protein
MRAWSAPAVIAIAAAVLGACRQAPPEPLTGGSQASNPPTTPAPTAVWRNHEIVVTGLPAIAENGAVVVVAHRDSDGGRGNPNLTLIERDRRDEVVRQLQVITATEVDQLTPAEIERRFSAAAGWLEERHAARHLVAMTALEAHPPIDTTPGFATGRHGEIVRWAPSTLEVDLGSRPASSGSGAGSAPGPHLTRATPPTWLVADRPLCATCTEVCHIDAFLGGAYLDIARRAAIVVVSFRGSDTCAEPGSQEHVVIW